MQHSNCGTHKMSIFTCARTQFLARASFLFETSLVLLGFAAGKWMFVHHLLFLRLQLPPPPSILHMRAQMHLRALSMFLTSKSCDKI